MKFTGVTYWNESLLQMMAVLVFWSTLKFLKLLRWRGVVWCGVVWCGVVWCGVVWCGVVWCGVVCCVV